MNRIKERRRCSNYRQRQKDEREHLHEQVKTLTTELNSLKKSKEEGDSSSSGWKLFAERQLEARKTSENDQIHLCEAIQARAAIIREIQDMPQVRITSDVDGVNAAPYKRQTTAGHDACSTTPFCQLFVQDLDSIYAQTDECLLAFDDNSLEDSLEVWKEDDETGTFHFMERQEMLCDFDEACQTLWEAAKLSHRQDERNDFDGVPDPENTSAFNFRVLKYLGSGQVVSALQHVVSRCYRTRDRMVFVWQKFMDGEGIFTGLRAGETGWDVLTLAADIGTVVRRTVIWHTPMHLRAGETGWDVLTLAADTGTVERRTVIWHTPMHIDGTMLCEEVVKEFASLTIGSVTEDEDEISKKFDELRIHDTFGGSESKVSSICI
ncbi:hypothetical protein PHMEG_0004909 [Phytophthora megakarya]|uniref:M96 mating-specific protein n=1 Tax=Phytophthora megakarya TaxID=4795 RepID=A0A225WU92_9STRA|nr:hypothetical protein PHMEG_0004909 [Phytophthora megakarya]